MSGTLSIVLLVLLTLLLMALAAAEAALTNISQSRAEALEEEEMEGADTLVRVLADPRISPRSRGAWFLLLGLIGHEAERRHLAAWMRDAEAQVAPGYDALLVGGASEASVLEPENYPSVPHCINLLRHCIDVDFPVFASCFGFQLAVLAGLPTTPFGPIGRITMRPSDRRSTATNR